MALFQFRWLRSFIRRNTNQIPEQQAIIWKRRLSVAYMLLAWNAVGLVVYMIYNGKSDWAKPYKSEMEQRMTPAQQWATTLGIKEAKVIRISGTNISRYEISNNPDDAQKNENEATNK